MTAIFQRWTPTKAEADLLVDMLTARLSQAKIAKALYIDVRTLKAFLARLDAAADAPAPGMRVAAAQAAAAGGPAGRCGKTICRRRRPVGLPPKSRC